MNHLSSVRGLTRRREAFTTIELLVSTLLASILMVALLGVLRGVRMQAQAIENIGLRPGWQRVLDHVLQHDLANSRFYQFDDSSLTLVGFAGRQLDSRAATWAPATISYEIFQGNQTGWLVRTEKQINRDGNIVGEHKELVLSGIDSIRLRADSDSPVVPEGNKTGLAPARVATPIEEMLVVEFWTKQATAIGSDKGGPMYAYRFRKH